MTEPTPDTAATRDRWPFIRDVLVFQLKLVLGNVQNFILLPVSIAAAVLDLVSAPRERQDGYFYKVMEIGRQVDENINIYGAIGGYHATGASPAAVGIATGTDGGAAEPSGWHGTTVDGVVRSVEDVIVRELKKGGTAASVKAAVDRVLDDLQRESKKK